MNKRTIYSGEGGHEPPIEPINPFKYPKMKRYWPAMPQFEPAQPLIPSHYPQQVGHISRYVYSAPAPTERPNAYLFHQTPPGTEPTVPTDTDDPDELLKVLGTIMSQGQGAAGGTLPGGPPVNQQAQLPGNRKKPQVVSEGGYDWVWEEEYPETVDAKGNAVPATGKWRKLGETPKPDILSAEDEMRKGISQARLDFDKAQADLKNARAEKKDSDTLEVLQKRAEIAKRALDLKEADMERKIAESEGKLALGNRKLDASIDPTTGMPWNSLFAMQKNQNDIAKASWEANLKSTNQQTAQAQKENDIQKEQEDYAKQVKQDQIMRQIFGDNYANKKREKKWWEFLPGGQDMAKRFYDQRMNVPAPINTPFTEWRNPTTGQIEPVNKPYTGPMEPLPGASPYGGNNWIDRDQMRFEDQATAYRQAEAGLPGGRPMLNQFVNPKDPQTATDDFDRAMRQWTSNMPISEEERQARARQNSLSKIGRSTPFQQR